MRMMRIKIHKQPSFPQPHPFPKQPIQAPPFFKFLNRFLLCSAQEPPLHIIHRRDYVRHTPLTDYQSQPQPQSLLQPQPLLFPQQQQIRIMRMIIHKQPLFPHPLPNISLHLLFCAHFIIRQSLVLVTANKKLFVKV